MSIRAFRENARHYGYNSIGLNLRRDEKLWRSNGFVEMAECYRLPAPDDAEPMPERRTRRILTSLRTS